MKLRKLERQVDGKPVVYGYAFFCPACNEDHWVNPRGLDPKKPNEGWQVKFAETDKPTIHPSLKVTGIQNHLTTICHLFVKEGKIEYQKDCTHALKGQTVPMVDRP
jgi:hypothetical protein